MHRDSEWSKRWIQGRNEWIHTDRFLLLLLFSEALKKQKRVTKAGKQKKAGNANYTNNVDFRTVLSFLL